MKLENICDFHCDKITGGKVAEFQLEINEKKDVMCFLPKFMDPQNSTLAGTPVSSPCRSARGDGPAGLGRHRP